MVLRNTVFFILLFLVTAAQAETTKVTASVDKNPVMLDEAFTLTVMAEGDADREAFDSSPLLTDFVVGRTSVSSQTQIINFDTRQFTTWTTTLFPRKLGSVTIPAISIEGKTTSPITMKVIPAPTGDAKGTRDYYVTTSVDNNNVFLQQQLLYTVKLYIATQIERGSLQAPELENASIQQLGEDKQYTDIVNGKRYQVIERHFAVIPQQSGSFTIRGPVFSGEVVAANTNQRFGFFNRTSTVSRVGPDVAITVKPVPSNIDYPWLPSEFVQLDEQWQSDNFVVGEPVTRTVTLTAVGVAEEQLPELPQRYPPNFKLYPDQANTVTAVKDNKLIVQRIESVAVIPTKAGDIVLPDITVPWYNVKTGQTEYAKLAARTISVKPASGNVASQVTPTPSAQNTPSSTLPPVNAPSTSSLPIQPQPESEMWNTTNWLLAGLWLVTLCGWSMTVYHYRKHYRKEHVLPTETTSYSLLTLDEVINIVRSGDAKQIIPALQRWTQDQKQQLSATQWLALQQQLQPEIDSLMKSRFSPSPVTWDGQNLIAVLTSIKKNGKTANKHHRLAPLYPDSTHIN